MNKISKKEITTSIVIIAVLFLVAIYDCILSYYGYKLYTPYIIKDLDCSDLISILFQVQASVATLGIAIIALLSEASKQYVFGISVSNYIMNDKRSIFKCKIIVITELIFVILNYIFMAVKFYNLAIMIFLVSIGLIIFMSCDIFVVFYGSRQVKNEIKEYYLKHFKKLYDKKYDSKREVILDNLGKDIYEGILNNDSVKTQEDFDFLFKIFREIINENDSENDSENNRKLLILKKWQQICSDKCISMFEKKNNEKTLYMIRYIYEVYNECNKYNEKNKSNIYLNIWDNVENSFFKSLSNITPKNIMEDQSLFGLRNQLYKNTYIEVSKENKLQKSNYRLKNFSSEVYNRLFHSNKNILDKEESEKLKEELVLRRSWWIGLLFLDQELQEIDYIKNKIVFSELSNYTITLINNFEYTALENTFLERLKSCYLECSEDEHNYDNESLIDKWAFTILIYIYYIYYLFKRKSEDGYDDLSNLIKFLDKLLGNNNDIMVSFFYDVNIDYKFNKQFIHDIKNILYENEMQCRHEWEWSVMDYTANVFFLFFALKKYNSLDELTKNISKIVDRDEFTPFDFILECDQEDVKLDFKIFLGLFKIQIDDKELNDKINFLEKAMKIADKRNSGIKKLEKNKINKEDFEKSLF